MRSEDLTPQQTKAYIWLKKQFDKTFSTYCTQLRAGVPTKIFIADTSDNRLIMGEFRDNYLPQRAAFEGWEYKPENLQIIYTDNTDKLPDKPIILLDPKDRNLGFEEVDKRSDMVRRLKQKDSDRIRDNLQSRLDN